MTIEGISVNEALMMKGENNVKKTYNQFQKLADKWLEKYGYCTSCSFRDFMTEHFNIEEDSRDDEILTLIIRYTF